MESKTLAPVRHCVECGGRGRINLHWSPPVRIDPHLKQFICSSCGSIFYGVFITGGKEQMSLFEYGVDSKP